MNYLLRLLVYSGHAGYEGEHRLPSPLLLITNVRKPEYQGQLSLSVLVDIDGGRWGLSKTITIN